MLESHRKRRGSKCSSLLPYLIYSPLFGNPLWVWGMIIPFPGKGHLYKEPYRFRDRKLRPGLRRNQGRENTAGRERQFVN